MARLDTSRKVTTYFHLDDDFDIYTYIYTNNNDDLGGDEYDVTWQGWIIFFKKMITMIMIKMTNHHDMYMIFYIVYMTLYQMIKMKVTPVSLASLRTERLLPPPCNPKIQLYNAMI